ncbi:MAG: radical SAM protein [Endomicrobiales bacterium]|nr:radical SAM protein [Endomicrobiales bacterium]
MKAKVLAEIPKKYKRYGLPEDLFLKELEKIDYPDIVLVTSGMTYWYPGVLEVIKTIKERFPKSSVILGGVYASICPEHARRYSGADHIITGSDLSEFFKTISGKGFKPTINKIPESFSDFPMPDYEMYDSLEYIALRTTIGCPFRCSYCSIKTLCGDKFERKPPEKIVSEIKYLSDKGIKNLAFYDDALFFEPDKHIVPVLDEIKKQKLKMNIHSPNGLHAKFITPGLAKTMKESNFVMPRVSLETINKETQEKTGGKVNNENFLAACENLKAAGYKPGEISSYLMIGMPDQDFSEVEESIRFVHSQGAKVFLAEYSPIPDTKDWEKAEKIIPSDDPLWHNNSIFPLYPLSDWPKFQKLKDLALELNKSFLL